jgi:NADH dehydrogenase
VVPLRMMCPDAELVLGRAVRVDAERRRVSVADERGWLEIGYERLVLALGAVTRVVPIEGLDRHALGLKTMGDAIRLRMHALHQLDLAEADPANAERHLTFVFVGAGYAGIEGLAELGDMVADALPSYPALQGVRQRWVLIDGGSRVLQTAPERLSRFAEEQLRARGTDMRLGARLAAVHERGVTLSDGSHIDAGTVVWTAGVQAHPLVARFGFPTDGGGRVKCSLSGTAPRCRMPRRRAPATRPRASTRCARRSSSPRTSAVARSRTASTRSARWPRWVAPPASPTSRA